MTECSVLPIASSLHDRDVLGAIVGRLRPVLGRAGAVLVDTVEEAHATAPFALLVMTGGTERATLAACATRRAGAPGEPVLLLVHPDQNSLPAALETLARLRQDGVRGRILPLPGPRDDAAPLLEAIHDLTVWHALHRARIGLVGPPSDWLVASSPPPDVVTTTWGPTVVDIDLPEALDRYRDQTDAPLATPVRIGARAVHEPSDEDVTAAARFEPVLRTVVQDARVDAVAVRCFDLVTDAHTSGCLALSALNDDGIVAGCEGDLASTIGLLWAKLLTGRLGWMANPAVADPVTGMIELAHCTVPRSLVTTYDLRSHFESGLGVGIAGEFPPGPVTLLRIGGRALDQLWCVEAEALPTAPREGRCRTQVDVRAPSADVADLLERPLGNHLVVVPGRHADRLRAWWGRMIAPVTG